MSRWTSRDLLQALLLVFDECISRGASFSPLPIAGAIIDEVTLQEGRLVTAAYGLPRWLVGTRTQSSRGLGGFLARLDEAETSDTWDAWSEAWVEWSDSPEILEDLRSLHQQLLVPRPPPRLELQRIQEGWYEIDRRTHGLVESRKLAAAVTGDPPTTADLRRALARGDHFARECAARLLRFDIPVVIADRGLLLGAFLDLDRDPGPVALEPLPGGVAPHAERLYRLVAGEGSLRDALLGGEFREGVQRGIEAARELLGGLGAVEARRRLASARVSLTGLLPLAPAGPLTGGSAALSVALHALHRVGGPALRRPRLIASGSMDRDHRLEPMETRFIEAKATAVREDGTSDGLLALPKLNDPVAGLERLSGPAPTLHTAAMTVWGQTWPEWSEQQRVLAYQGLKVNPAWTEEGPRAGGLSVDGTPVVVHTATEDAVFKAFASSVDEHVVIVGGPYRSGKSWLARNVVERLQNHAPPWSVVAFSVEASAAPTADQLAEAFLIATGSRDPRRRQLLVLDDLRWREGLESLDELLIEVRVKTGASVLALVLSNRETERHAGQADRVEYRPAMVNEQQLREFAVVALAQYPALSVPDSLLSALVKKASTDLWLLTRLLVVAGDPSVTAKDAQGVLAAFADEYGHALDGASPVRLASVGRLAALSYINLPAPEHLLDDVPEEVLRSLAAVEEPPGSWRIPSIHACNMLLRQLQRSGGAKDTDSVLFDHLRQVTMRLLSDDPSAVLIALEESARKLKGVSSRLLVDAKPDLLAAARSWASAPRSLPRLVRLLDTILTTKERAELVSRIARQLVDGASDTLRPSDLSMAVETVLKYRDFLWYGKRYDSEDLLGQLREELGAEDRLRTVLANVVHPAQRIPLLPVLYKLHGRKGMADVARKVDEEFFHCESPFDITHYQAALRIIKELDRVRPGGARFEPSNSPTVVEMTRHRPQDDSLVSYLAWCALRQRCSLRAGDWDAQLQGMVAEIQRRLVHSPLTDLVEGLRLIREVRRSGAAELLRELGHGQLLDLIRIRLPRLNPSQVQQFLAMLSGLSPVLAYQVLYPSGLPDATLATSFATQVQQAGEARGAGKLLEACNHIDALYGSPMAGFAHLLAGHMGAGFVSEVLESEPRTLVVFNMVHQLLVANAGYLPDILDEVMERIQAECKSDDRAEAPRLALKLATDPLLASRRPVFDELVRDPALVRKVGERMLIAPNEDALAAYHQLGCALDLDGKLAERFRAAFQKDTTTFNRLVRGDRPEVLLRAAGAVTVTLRRGGVDNPGKLAAARAVEVWQGRDTATSPPDGIVEGMRILRKLDPEAARRLLTEGSLRLDQVLKNRRHYLSACDLLAGVDKILPYAGRRLFEQQGDKWQAELLDDIIYDSDIMGQAQALRLLSELVPDSWPDHSTRDQIHGTWVRELDRVRSPAILVDVLRCFAIWGPTWLREAAYRADWKAVAARITHGASWDLDRVASLISVTTALSLEDAGIVAEVLTGIPRLPERMSLRAAADLLGVLRLAHPSLARELAATWPSRVVAAARSPYVVNDSEHWLSIGWMSYRLQRLGHEVDVPDLPKSLGAFQDAQVRLWGIGWFRQRAWAADKLEEAFNQQLWRFSRPWAVASVLSVAATHGRLHELLEPDHGLPESFWASALQASPRSVGMLLEEATRAPELAALLAPHLRDRLQWLDHPRWSAHQEVVAIRRRLEEIATATA